MAKPELNDGWVQLAYELDAAIDVGDFTKAERVVLNVAKMQVYGEPKLKKALVMILNIAEAGGWKRQFVEKGLRLLLKANVLQAVDGGFRINKYYRTWTYSDGTTHEDNNGSRFSDGELVFIEDSTERGKSFLHVLSNQRVANKAKCLATNELQDPSKNDDLGNSPSNQRVAVLQPTSCEIATNELQPPLHRTPASEDLIQINSDSSSSEDDDDDSCNSSRPQTPNLNGHHTPAAPSDPPADPATEAELLTWVEASVDPLEEINAGRVHNFVAAHGVVRTYAAILEGVPRAHRGKLAAYIARCLANWKQQGGPPKAPPARASPNLEPAPPPFVIDPAHRKAIRESNYET